MIDISNLQAGYGSKIVLHDLNARAGSGEFIALLGPNGSGKSTLLKTLCGIIEPLNGQVTLSGENLHQQPAKQRARTIAYLAQGREAAAGLKVSDILEIGRAPYRGRLGKISREGYAAIESAAAQTQVSEFLDRKYESLSGGEQARVLLARALAVRAPVLLADEPIAALDPFYQLTSMDILKAQAKAGRLVIAALHDLALAHQYADKIWVMKAGQIVKVGTPQEALSAETLQGVFGIEPPRKGFQLMERFQALLITEA